jgi:hypothetical protein
MHMLKTKAGYISSRWIVRVSQRPQGDWEIGYTYGAGMMETTCTGQEGVAYLRSYRPSAGGEGEV